MKTRIILITEDDLQRLEQLVESARRFQPRNQEHLIQLEEELQKARIVTAAEIPHDVVTMNSEVRVTDLDTGRETSYKVVFPRDAQAAENRISVLAPIGTALLGYRAGDVIEWEMPSGKKRLKVEAVVYQPEAVRPAV